jgi:dTDP-4-amino-4,6-dideoxygalactose transaminase
VRVIDAAQPTQRNSHYSLSLVLGGALAARRDEMVGRLNAEGVGTSIYYPQPVPRMSYYRKKYGYDGSRYPHATEISDCSITMPVGPHLDQADIDYMADVTRRALSAGRQA